MKNRIREHQATQELRWQVTELMEHALNSWRLVQKLRSKIFDLLVEHEKGNTNNFWENARQVYSQDDDELR